MAHERLVRICHVDGEREVALVVDYENRRTWQQQILRVGRLIKLDAQNEAEVAILVSDQYEKWGLGTELLRRLIQIARDQKLHRVSVNCCVTIWPCRSLSKTWLSFSSLRRRHVYSCSSRTLIPHL